MIKSKNIYTPQFDSGSRQNMAHTNTVITFNITLGKLLVGKLVYSDGVWHFNYSDEFKKQNRILPLVNFPSKDKEYSARELWPFFTSRIPSNAQLQIDKDVHREDIVVLLQKFGRKTVTNPFELCHVEA